MPKAADSARDYVAALTGLRGVAALLVFLFHYEALNPGIRLDRLVPVVGNVLQFPFGLGFAGVDLFFVLSGFLLTLPFAWARLNGLPLPALGHYYRRRLLRVFPAYYAQLAILLIGGAWFVTWRHLGGGTLLAHLGMAFNVGSHPVHPMVGLWWTLPVELSFYLILPWLATFLLPRRWLPLLALGLLLAVVYRAWAADHFAASGARVVLVASHLPGSLPEFLLGASGALLVQWLDFRSIRRPAPLVRDLLFLAGMLAAGLWLWLVVLPNGVVYWRGHWSMLIGTTVLGFSLAVAVTALYWGSRVGRVLLANPVVYFLGLVSYSLYLWHFVVMQQAPVVFGDSWGALTGLPRFLATTALVVAVASASYFLFERPFFRLRGRRRLATA